MLSSELAELAGVTVRTLRHYHQIGLLAEPSRSVGGYRRYGVGDLVRLLRITRLAALGLPLSALPAVLEDPAVAEEMFDELDREAADDIDRLVRRRADIAELRRSGAPADLPPTMSSLRSGFAAALPEDMSRFEHEQLILAGHLLGKDDPAALAAVFSTPEGDESALTALTSRFYALTADTSAEDEDALVEQLATHLEPIHTHFVGGSSIDPRAAELMNELNRQTLRPIQQQVLGRVQQKWAR